MGDFGLVCSMSDYEFVAGNSLFVSSCNINDSSDQLCHIFDHFIVGVSRWETMVSSLLAPLRSDFPVDPIQIGSLSNVVYNDLELVDSRVQLFFDTVFDECESVGFDKAKYSNISLMWGEHCYEICELVQVDCHKHRISFSGIDRRSGKSVFIKIQCMFDWVQDGFTYFRVSGIENEISILEYLSDVPYIPCVKSYGVENGYKYIITELLSPLTFGYLVKRNHWKKSHSLHVKTFCHLGKMHDVVYGTSLLIKNLHRLHCLNILHKDIKADNICFGVGPFRDQLYFVDFETAWHRSFPLKCDRHLIFSPTFTSHLANEQSYTCRDELISLGFVLMAMFCPLPWMNLEDSLTRTEWKCMSKEELDERRNILKRGMFYRDCVSGYWTFRGDVPVMFPNHYAPVMFRDVLRKPCEKLLHFFIVYFDIVMNKGSVSKFQF